MSDSTAIVLKPTLDPRSDSTQICCPGSCFFRVCLYQACTQAFTPHFGLEFLSFVFEEKADGGGELGPSGTEVISCLGCKCS